MNQRTGTETVVEQTIDGIRAAIREGRYVQGQRLVVTDIMEAFGVSAGPVREAIRRLSGDGLVEITPHRGASVRRFRSKEMRDIYAVREIVEGLAARLAAERIDVDSHRSSITKSIDIMRSIVASGGEGYFDHNETFHDLIYFMADNEQLRATALQLSQPVFQMGAHRLLGRDYYRVASQEHELIAASILGGDGPGAERMMRNHVRASGMVALEIVEAATASSRRVRKRVF